jgi:hypothetical protein
VPGAVRVCISQPRRSNLDKISDRVLSNRSRCLLVFSFVVFSATEHCDRFSIHQSLGLYIEVPQLKGPAMPILCLNFKDVSQAAVHTCACCRTYSPGVGLVRDDLLRLPIVALAISLAHYCSGGHITAAGGAQPPANATISRMPWQTTGRWPCT